MKARINTHQQIKQRLVQQGFTLIELLIALGIGILLMSSVLMIMVSAMQSGRVSDAETAMNEEGLIVLNLLQQQIRLAGYSNTVTDTGTITKNFTGTSIRGCDKGFADAGVAFNSLTCNTSGADNGAIAIRYEADLQNTTPAGSTTLRPTNCQLNNIDKKSGAEDWEPSTDSAVTGQPKYSLADNRYFVRTSGTDSGRPELSCRGATSATTYDVVQPLIENVEQLKFIYGITRTNDAADMQIVTYKTASEIDSDFSGEAMADRWRRVASVKICVLMRSVEPARDNSISGQSYKDCDGTTQTSTDGYLRRAYITTAQLRNKASVPLEKR